MPRNKFLLQYRLVAGSFHTGEITDCSTLFRAAGSKIFGVVSVGLDLHGRLVCDRVPVHQVRPVLWSHGVRGVPLWDAHVDDPSLVVRMDQLVLPPPLPVGCVLFCSFPVHPAHQARDRDPEEQGHDDHRPHHIVLQELEHCADADVVDKVPDPDNVLIGFLALALVAEPLEARGAIRENVNWCHSVARAVEVPPATPLAAALLGLASP